MSEEARVSEIQDKFGDDDDDDEGDALVRADGRAELGDGEGEHGVHEEPDADEARAERLVAVVAGRGRDLFLLDERLDGAQDGRLEAVVDVCVVMRVSTMYERGRKGSSESDAPSWTRSCVSTTFSSPSALDLAAGSASTLSEPLVPHDTSCRLQKA